MDSGRKTVALAVATAIVLLVAGLLVHVAVRSPQRPERDDTLPDRRALAAERQPSRDRDAERRRAEEARKEQGVRDPLWHRPGEKAALSAARARFPDQSLTVGAHTPDWGEVTILAGPAPEQPTTLLVLSWTGRRYVPIRQEPILPQPPPGYSSARNALPDP